MHEQDERPSKSARKRAAHAAQELGEALILLKDSELEELALPDQLLDAIRLARRITSRAGSARQRQYIGRLMRQLDTAPIEAALAASSERAARDTKRFKRIEAWRDRLIAEGVPALTELAALHPTLDRESWSRKIEAARHERTVAGSTGKAARALFRDLRALLDPATIPR